MKLKIIFFTVLLTHFLLAVFMVFKPIAYFRIVDTTQASYPNMWLTPLFTTIEMIVTTPLRLIPLSSGWEGLSQLVLLIYVWVLSVPIVILVLGHKILKKRKFILLCVVIAICILLLALQETIKESVYKFSEKASVEINAAKNTLDNSIIKFSVVESKLVSTEPSKYFPGKKRMIFDVIMSVNDVPEKLPNFLILFKEADFYEYQLYGSWGCRCDFASTSLIDYIEVENKAGILTFRNPHTQKIINIDQNNTARFKLSVELKNQQPPEQIGFSPRLDINIKDELDYANDNPIRYRSKDISKTDYPVFFLNL